MILVTGGAGYIGAHVVLELMAYGEEVIILDNLCNSSRYALERIASVSGQRPVFIQGDVRNRGVLDTLFSEHQIDAVIHCAGLKAVGESVREPLRYYDTNVGGSVTLCRPWPTPGYLPWSSALLRRSTATAPRCPSPSPAPPASHPIPTVNRN